jgi:hypothetical protein
MLPMNEWSKAHDAPPAQPPACCVPVLSEINFVLVRAAASVLQLTLLSSQADVSQFFS